MESDLSIRARDADPGPTVHTPVGGPQPIRGRDLIGPAHPGYVDGVSVVDNGETRGGMLWSAREVAGMALDSLARWVRGEKR